MESVSDRPVEMPGDTEPELQLLTNWEVLEDRGRTRTAVTLSVLAHVGLVITWLALPRSVTDPVREAVVWQITPLIAPLTDLTQPAPNRSKVSKEFNVESQAPRPSVHLPPPRPAPIRMPAAVPRKLAPPPEKKATPAPAPNLPDAPKVEVAQQNPQVNVPNAPPPVAPPPQIQPPPEKPKLVLETPPASSSGKGTGKLAQPNASVQDALRSVMRGGASGGLVIGDVDLMSAPSVRGSLSGPALPGKSGAYMELKFDPQSVDFRPYLTQILATIKRNWFVVWPQSARMGRQGRVAIQIAIARNGNVTKLVIASPSGADPLDKAAVSGISASNPLPELPGDFKGNEIRLQLNFVYNMK